MNLGRAIARGIVGEIEKESRRRETYTRLQSEAASRPGSTHVQTPWGPVWMSPIEHRLYEAMRKDGLDPVPQFRIEGYYADFAFPDVRLAVEADGAAYHGEDRRQRDRRRDWILRQKGDRSSGPRLKGGCGAPERLAPPVLAGSIGPGGIRRGPPPCT